MRKPGTGAARREQHAVLHLRPRSRHIASAVIEGPFDDGGEALETAAKLRRTAAAGDQVEVLTGAGPWLGSDPDERTERAEELARRVLRRLRGFPGDFDPRATTARRPPERSSR